MKKTAKKTANKPAKRTKKPGKLRGTKAAVKVAGKGPAFLSKSEVENAALLLRKMKDSISKTMEEKKKLDLPEIEVGDAIDQASQSLEKEILFELSDSEMTDLGDIEAALRKIENDTYGVCEHCKRPIGKKRIKALPSARYCMVCQNGSEKQRAR